MMQQTTLTAARRIVLALLLVLPVVTFFVGRHRGERLALEKMEQLPPDTVTKIVPIYKDRPRPKETARFGYISVPAYKFLSDTVRAVETAYLRDTATFYLPRERQYYSEADGRLRIWVSGYQPSLDRYELDLAEKIVTQTVVAPVKRWKLSLYGGGEYTSAGGQALHGARAGAALTYEDPRSWGLTIYGGGDYTHLPGLSAFGWQAGVLGTYKILQF